MQWGYRNGTIPYLAYRRCSINVVTLPVFPDVLPELYVMTKIWSQLWELNLLSLGFSPAFSPTALAMWLSPCFCIYCIILHYLLCIVSYWFSSCLCTIILSCVNHSVFEFPTLSSNLIMKKWYSTDAADFIELVHLHS